MCDVLWDCGGASSSSNFTSTFNSLVSSTQNYITTNSTTSTSAVQAYQTAEIDIGGSAYPPCDITQIQSINVNSQNGVNLSKSSTSDLRNFITNQLANTANQFSAAQSSTFGGSASSATNTNVTQNITDITNTTVSDNNYQTMSTEVMGQQDGHIRIKGDCHVPLRQDQNFAATVLATNIMNQIVNQLGGTTSNTTSTNTVTQTSTATTKGPWQSLADMFSSLGAIGAIVCILCILAVLGGGAFFMYTQFGPKGAVPGP
jgi:hypothetical protein